jgi:hypothetical protein
MRRKEMRVTNRNRFHSTQTLDRLDRLIIQIRNTIPQNIPLWRPHQISALSDRDLRFRANGDEVCRGSFVRVERVEDVFVAFFGAEG